MPNKHNFKKYQYSSHHHGLDNITIFIVLLIFLILGSWGFLESISLFIQLIVNVSSSSLRDFDVGIDIFALGMFGLWTLCLARWFSDFVADWIFHQS